MLIYAIMILGILYLNGLPVGVPLAICGIVSGACIIIKTICDKILDKLKK